MLNIAKYRPEIDGLRAVAVVSVMIFHTGLDLLPGGYIGVDVFFVISGFLITTIIHRELSENRFSLLTFYERRMRRIFPALFMVIIASVPIAWIIMTPGQLKNFSQSVLATSVFLSNIYFFLKTGYFDQRAEELPMLHTWSLAVEEQYYIVFPFLMMAIWAMRPRLMKPILVVLFFVSLYLSISFETDRPSFNFFMLPTRGWELLVGAFLAVNFKLLRGWLARTGPLPQALELAGVAGILAPMFYLTGASAFPGTNALPVVFGTAFLILAMTPTSPVGRVMSSRAFVAIGLVSYSAYLIHQPLFVFTRLVLKHPGPLLLFGLIVLTFVLAWVSWRFVEMPFRQKGRVSRKVLFASGISAMMVFTGLGAAGHILKGVPQRFDDATLKIAASAEQSPWRGTCHTDGTGYLKPQKACEYQKGPATWAVFGDSHVVEIAAALSEQLKPLDQSVKHLSFSGCPPALDFDLKNPGCHSWTKEAVEYLEKSDTITSVLLVYRHSFHLYGDQVKNYPAIPDSAPSFLRKAGATKAREEYWKGLGKIISRLRASGKTVYILEPVPELGEHVERMIFSGKTSGAPASVKGPPISYYQQRNADILERLKSLSNGGQVRVLKSVPAICPKKYCLAIDKGKALFFDDNHLSMEGARRVIRYAIDKGLIKLTGAGE